MECPVRILLASIIACLLASAVAGSIHLERYEKIQATSFTGLAGPVLVRSLIACGGSCAKLDTCQGFHVTVTAEKDRVVCQQLSLIEEAISMGEQTDKLRVYKLVRTLRSATTLGSTSMEPTTKQISTITTQSTSTKKPLESSSSSVWPTSASITMPSSTMTPTLQVTTTNGEQTLWLLAFPETSLNLVLYTKTCQSYSLKE